MLARSVTIAFYRVYLLLLFPFLCTHDLRDLPSFPPRRSSDLRAGPPPAQRSSADRLEPHPREDLAPGRGRRVGRGLTGDRKSTRLNSSHVANSYAVFCLNKKTGHRQ